MINVTRVIAGLTIFLLLGGCGKEAPKSKPDYSILPQNVEIPKLGKVTHISPKALADSINSGANLQMIFLQDYQSTSPELMVSLPGMATVMLGDAVNYIKKLDRSKPLFLICPWGDDSKRMGGEFAKEGWNSYYLDGGTFRLIKELSEKKIRINSFGS